MMRRMSKRLAAFAAVASSTSGSAGAWGSFAMLAPPSDEDDVEDHDERQRAYAEQHRRPVPGALLLGQPLGLGILARQPPDQPAELVLRLGLGDQRHGHRHDGVRDERD